MYFLIKNSEQVGVIQGSLESPWSHNEINSSNLPWLIRTDAQLRIYPPPVTVKCLKFSSVVCRNLIPPLITSLQRQWTQWVQRRSFQMTSEPPPEKRHGSPLTEWRLQNHFKLMDLRDCPHNYITAFQQPFELHTCSLGTPQPFIHIIAPQWNVLWQIWPSWAPLNKVALHGTGNPLIPLHTSSWI